MQLVQRVDCSTIDCNVIEAIVGDSDGIVVVSLVGPVTGCQTDCSLTVNSCLIQVHVVNSTAINGVIVMNQTGNCTNRSPCSDVQVLNGTIHNTVVAFTQPANDTASHGLFSNGDLAHAVSNNGTVGNDYITVSNNTCSISIVCDQLNGTGNMTVRNTASVHSTCNRTNIGVSMNINILNIHIVNLAALNITKHASIRQISIFDLQVADCVALTIKSTLEAIGLSADRSPLFTTQIDICIQVNNLTSVRVAAIYSVTESFEIIQSANSSTISRIHCCAIAAVCILIDHIAIG